MPRKKLLRTSDFPYHITTRSNNREWFQLPLCSVWSYCLKSLTYAHDKIPINFHAFVLMGNHYHLLMSTPNANIDQFMYFFNKHLADQLRVHSKRINRVFGGPYSWCLVDHETYLYNVVRYVFQNPLRKGIVTLVQDYPFSTLRYEVNNLKFPLNITQLFETPHRSNTMLEWFNHTQEKSQDRVIQKALRRSSFLPAKDSNTGKVFELSSFPTQNS